MGWAVPSVSKASLTSFGTALRDVLPRHANTEGPLASLGAIKKERARGDKKRESSGRQKGAFGATKRGGSARLDSDSFFIYNNNLCYPLS